MHRLIRMAPCGADVLPLCLLWSNQPFLCKGKMSGTHAAPLLEELLQGLSGHSSSCSSKPPPVFLSLVARFRLSNNKMRSIHWNCFFFKKAVAARLDGEDMSVMHECFGVQITSQGRVRVATRPLKMMSSNRHLWSFYMKLTEDICVLELMMIIGNKLTTKQQQNNNKMFSTSSSIRDACFV